MLRIGEYNTLVVDREKDFGFYLVDKQSKEDVLLPKSLAEGMGAIILNNAKIGNNTIIGAGSLITQGKEFPEGVLILGNPAKIVRELNDDEIKNIKASSKNYVELSKKYK